MLQIHIIGLEGVELLARGSVYTEDLWHCCFWLCICHMLSKMLYGCYVQLWRARMLAAKQEEGVAAEVGQ
jgi:hypothetical protein